MDKIRTFFRVMWTQRFWVLTCTALLVSSLCWMMGSGALQEEFKKEKGDIESKFSSIQSIASTQVHGNAQINEAEALEVLKLRKTVMTLWQQLYEQQREQVLKWPPVLGDDFIAELQDKQFGDRISRPKRERYLNYIENRFESLLEIVGALNEVGQAGAGARRGGTRWAEKG